MRSSRTPRAARASRSPARSWASAGTRVYPTARIPRSSGRGFQVPTSAYARGLWAPVSARRDRQIGVRASTAVTRRERRAAPPEVLAPHPAAIVVPEVEAREVVVAEHVAVADRVDASLDAVVTPATREQSALCGEVALDVPVEPRGGVPRGQVDAAQRRA